MNDESMELLFRAAGEALYNQSKIMRHLGIVKFDEYGYDDESTTNLVDECYVNAREEEIKLWKVLKMWQFKRKEETKKQKDKIEKEFRERLDKLKDAEYYAKMAADYGDKDPELVKLVKQLRELGD